MIITTPEILRAVQNSSFSPSLETSDIHPFRTPRPWAPTINVLHGLNLMIETVSANIDEDYGDFMRKANGALLHLQAEWGSERLIAENFNRIQNYVQFSPNWHVASTKDRLLKDLYCIRREIIQSAGLIRLTLVAKIAEAKPQEYKQAS